MNVSDFNDWLQLTLNIKYSPNWMSTAHTVPSVVNLCKEHGQDPKNFIPILYNALHPKNTKFQLMTIEQFVKSKIPYSDRECWIGDDVIALHCDVWKNIKGQI